MRPLAVLALAVVLGGCGGPSEDERRQYRLITLRGRVFSLQESVTHDQRLIDRMDEIAANDPDMREWALGMKQMVRDAAVWTMRERLRVQEEIDVLGRETDD